MITLGQFLIYLSRSDDLARLMQQRQLFTLQRHNKQTNSGKVVILIFFKVKIFEVNEVFHLILAHVQRSLNSNIQLLTKNRIKLSLN